MKRSILLGASIVFFLLVSLTGCEDPIYLTTDTDVMTVFLYDAYTGAPVAATDITSVEITDGGVTSTISTTENATGVISSTDNDTSLKFYNFEASETLKILILTTSYIRFETYVTPLATSRYPVYVAYLLPTAYVLKSPSYTYEIQDTGVAITAGGQYLITPAVGALDFGVNIDGTGPAVLLAYIPPNWGGNNADAAGDGAIAPLYGTIPDTGQIVIPADTLYPGVTYTLDIYDVPGYQDAPGAATLVPGTTSNAATIAIALTAM